MKIRKMSARFGALDGTLELSDGLNILTAPNESGKSTWCAFLRVMLYGVSTSQRAKQGQQPDKIKYRPWSGAPMEGRLDVTTPDGDVTIRRRTERDDRPMQAFSAVYTGTELPVPGITAKGAGEVLTGMPLPVFERSVFIGQAGGELTSDPELERRMSAIVSSGEEEVSFSDTDKRLRSWLRHRRSGRRGAIPETQAVMDGIDRTLAAVRADREEAAAAEEQIETLTARCAEKEKAMHEARARLRRQALDEMGAARKEAQRAEAERDRAAIDLDSAEQALAASDLGTLSPAEAEEQAERDRARSEELLSAAERLPALRGRWLPLILTLALAALGVLLPQKTLLFGLAGGMLLLLALLLLYKNSLKKRRQSLLAERASLLESYGVTDPEALDALLDRHFALWNDREAAAKSLSRTEDELNRRRIAQKAAEERAMGDLDFTTGNNEAARLYRELETLRARIGALRERRAMAEGRARALGDPAAMESERMEAQRRMEELLRQEDALTLALDTLGDADAELQQRLSPVLAQRAAAYFSELTGGRYDELTLARDLTARARLTGEDMGRDLGYLSAGTKDQLYLALRLAVCDLALPGDDPCPLVLDDALVFFDGERLGTALKLLKRLAKDRQILLFSCQDREAAFFAKDPSVHKLTLSGEGRTV